VRGCGLVEIVSTRTNSRYSVGKGAVSESVAEMFFRAIGWRMFRTQPPTKYISGKNRPQLIQLPSDGIADYTGYDESTLRYVACEVKQGGNGTCAAASKLRREQRAWMLGIAPECRYVCIVWGGAYPEIFEFISSGSYRRGEGLYRWEKC